MCHWANKYPHKICVSVILKSNKIMNWKIGQFSLKDKYNIDLLIEKDPEYSFQEHYFEAKNDKEHNNIFEIISRNWLKRWELHQEFVGESPFVCTLKAGDIVSFSEKNVTKN